MFKFGKKKKQEEMAEVKKEIEPAAPIITRTVEPKELERIDVPAVSTPKSFAPLYIKVDKYKEVLQKVQKLRTLVNNIRSLALLQDQIAKTREDASISLKKNIDDFENTAAQLDQELVRPSHFEPHIRETGVQSVEGYTKELENEVAKIKEQLGNF